ncbi:hypothetical protein SAY87_009369 [Trapa incisa]|uniref:Uncharacterized protein n=1 Tax=Trapa incisa TaxID=236973 RepID=A0AAN7PWW4_9MYRT|nr:hypothetical protein SAY87_009369 [Trapa incisa]
MVLSIGTSEHVSTTGAGVVEGACDEVAVGVLVDKEKLGIELVVPEEEEEGVVTTPNPVKEPIVAAENPPEDAGVVASDEGPLPTEGKDVIGVELVVPEEGVVTTPNPVKELIVPVENPPEDAGAVASDGPLWTEGKDVVEAEIATAGVDALVIVVGVEEAGAGEIENVKDAGPVADVVEAARETVDEAVVLNPSEDWVAAKVRVVAEVAPAVDAPKSPELPVDGIVAVPKRDLELTAEVGAPIGEGRETELGAEEAEDGIPKRLLELEEMADRVEAGVATLNKGEEELATPNKGEAELTADEAAPNRDGPVPAADEDGVPKGDGAAPPRAPNNGEVDAVVEGAEPKRVESKLEKDDPELAADAAPPKSDDPEPAKSDGALNTDEPVPAEEEEPKPKENEGAEAGAADAVPNDGVDVVKGEAEEEVAEGVEEKEKGAELAEEPEPEAEEDVGFAKELKEKPVEEEEELKEKPVEEEEELAEDPNENPDILPSLVLSISLSVLVQLQLWRGEGLRLEGLSYMKGRYLGRGNGYRNNLME